jgi:hypothetical protein
MIISRWIILRMRNVSDKSCTQNQNTHFMFNNFFAWKSCRLWDNVEKYGRARQAIDDNITRRMRFACWITKATDTHTQYVILIAFPRQQWLCERSSVWRYAWISYFVSLSQRCICDLRCSGYGTASPRNQWMAFPLFIGHWALEDESIIFSRNVGHQSPIGAEQHQREGRTEMWLGSWYCLVHGRICLRVSTQISAYTECDPSWFYSVFPNTFWIIL